MSAFADGLDPAIQVDVGARDGKLDHRVKPGDDEG
jgi:hypothetical protein